MNGRRIEADFPAISICVTVKNRSKVQAEGRELRLFPNCVASIVESARDKFNCELVVTDWESDDWPLAEWLPDAAKAFPLQLLPLTGKFSRGAGRNAAAKVARSRHLFFLDADCLICPAVLQEGVQAVSANQAFFPVLYSFKDPMHRDGWWRHQGYGNCIVQRDVFDKVGGFPEYGYWGREDVDFFNQVRAHQDVVRKEVPGFYHQWHPDDFEWKNRYGEVSPLQESKKAERASMAAVFAVMDQVIPVGGHFILVDEEHIRSQVPANRHAIPFLESDGEYGGVPADSNAAIAELERLRAAGASFLVLPWFTFWWLDYYADFCTYLHARYAKVVAMEQVLVFDLRSSTPPN